MNVSAIESVYVAPLHSWSVRIYRGLEVDVRIIMIALKLLLRLANPNRTARETIVEDDDSLAPSKSNLEDVRRRSISIPRSILDQLSPDEIPQTSNSEMSVPTTSRTTETVLTSSKSSPPHPYGL